MADSYTLGPGDRLGDFRIVRQLGEGGMGIVYLAHDEHLNRRVALKVIAPQLAHDPEFQKRFEAEARSTAAIDDHHVVPIYSAGSAEGRLYIAMRFVDGTDLRSVLSEAGAIEAGAAVAVVAEVAAALDPAPAAGLVHRDVKPANILLTGRPGAGSAYLTDFGLTKGLHSGGTQLTGTGQWIGTLDYVAPEQMTTGTVDARTDVYALGCVLYEALSGSVPFAGNDMQKMWGHVNEPPPALDQGRGHPLQAVIDRATAKDPTDRFPSAGDLARAAAAAIDGSGVVEAERSVATGVAASGLAEDSASTRTATMKAPAAAGHRERPTAAMPASPAGDSTHDRSRGGGGGGGTRMAAMLGAALVLAAGLIGGALVVANGKDSPTRTVVSAASKTTEATAESAEPAPTETAPIEEEAETAEASSSAVNSAYSQYLYSVEIPASWGQEASDESNGSYFESAWRDPADSNTSVHVDAETPAPSVSPLSSAESVRAQTSQSSGYREIAFESTSLSGLPAARWVFEVSGDRRVDYFINLCNVGVAVLGSTSPSSFGGWAPTFHEVAASVSVPCE